MIPARSTRGFDSLGAGAFVVVWFVDAAGQQIVSVGSEGHTRGGLLVQFKLLLQCSGRSVPDSDLPWLGGTCVVTGRGRNPFSVGRPCHTGHRIGVALQKDWRIV